MSQTHQTHHHESMVRRVEACHKALSDNVSGRSHRAGTARALSAVLVEVHERMDMAWAVLKQPSLETAAEQRYRSQNAAEIGLCYTLIRQIYDELCTVNAIPKDLQTEPTMQDLVREARKNEKPYKRIHRSKVRA